MAKEFTKSVAELKSTGQCLKPQAELDKLYGTGGMPGSACVNAKDVSVVSQRRYRLTASQPMLIAGKHVEAGETVENLTYADHRYLTLNGKNLDGYTDEAKALWEAETQAERDADLQREAEDKARREVMLKQTAGAETAKIIAKQEATIEALNKRLDKLEGGGGKGKGKEADADGKGGK